MKKSRKFKWAVITWFPAFFSFWILLALLPIPGVSFEEVPILMALCFVACGIWLFFAATDLLFHKSTYTPQQRKWMIAMILLTLGFLSWAIIPLLI